MFWKFGQTLLTKRRELYLSTEVPYRSRAFPVNTPVVYLGGDEKRGHVTIILKEVFDALAPQLTKKNTSTARKRYAHFQGYINVIPGSWVYTKELKEKGFEYLL